MYSCHIYTVDLYEVKNNTNIFLLHYEQTTTRFTLTNKVSLLVPWILVVFIIFLHSICFQVHCVE